jgi:predicted MFS family arabinose efflux permease
VSGPAPARSNWAALAGFAAAAATTQLLWLTFAPITTDAAKHYRVSEGAIGWLANVFPLCYVVLAIPAGLVLDRWLRGGVLLGALLTAAGGGLRLAGDSFGWALAGQVLVAIGQPLVLNAITGVAARYLADDDRAKGIALGTASTFAGMVVAFALGTALPLRGLLVVNALLAATAVAGLAVALRRPPTYGAAPSAGGVSAFRATWNDRYLRRLALLVFVPFGTFTALTTWAEALLDPAGVSSTQAGVLLLLNIVAGVGGSALLPVAAARRGRQLHVMAAAVMVTAAGCALLALAPGFALALVVFPVIGFVLLPCLPMVLELTERAAVATASTAAGLIWLSGQLGALVITGAIGTSVHHPLPAFLALAAVTLLALPALRAVHAVSARRSPPPGIRPPDATRPARPRPPAAPHGGSSR